MANTNFTITNLMTGDLVTLRNGKTGTVMLNTRIGDIIRYHSEKNSFSYIAKRFNDDLTHNKHSNMDIIKVHRIDASKVPMNKIGDLIANPEKMIADGKMVFDRDAAPAKPKLSDLITGDLLVHRNGKVSTVFKDTPVGDIIRYYTENNSFSYLSRYNDDLVHESKDGFDIVAVLRAPDVDESTIGDYIANPTKMFSDGVVVWSDGDIAASYYYNGVSGEARVSETPDTASDRTPRYPWGGEMVSNIDDVDPDDIEDEVREIADAVDSISEQLADVMDRLNDIF